MTRKPRSGLKVLRTKSRFGVYAAVFSAIAVAVVTFSGCASQQAVVKPSIHEIDAYIQKHPDLPELDKACIYDGRFEVGLRQSTVEFLLGDPKKVEIVHQPWAVQENWLYTKGGKKVFIMEDDHVVGILEE